MEEKRICSECGTENENDYVYCKNCGTLLGRPTEAQKAEQTAAPVTEQQTGAAAPGPEARPAGASYSAGFTPPEVAPGASPDGIPQEEIALFVGKKASTVMPKLIKMEITNSKVSWCWPPAILGFLFGPMGAALWFFYRKMYKKGALLAGIGAAMTLITTAMTFGTDSVDYGPIFEAFLSGNGQSLSEALSGIPTTAGILDVAAQLISNIADLLTCVFTGLFGYYAYKEHCVRTIRAYRQSIGDSRYYTMGLAAVGGVSGGMLAVGIVCMIFATNLSSVLTTVLSMLV